MNEITAGGSSAISVKRTQAGPAATPVISVIVPVKDEADNILPLVDEISAALAGRWEYEIVYVDDGSGDDTPARLVAARAAFPRLRALRHEANRGQSAAIRSGVVAARGRIVVTIDGDGQNDPADIPALVDRLEQGGGVEPLGMVAGIRQKRRDTMVRRLSSRIANGVRGLVLGDGISDTGCGLKAFERALFLKLPYFDHMHRFLPALVRREGLAVAGVPVNHRPRARGISKYGIANRLWVGIVDLAGVAWLMRRARPGVSREL